MKIYAKHLPYDDGHLGQVINDMMQLGPLTIRCIEYAGRCLALEGSHRLAAAKQLGLMPNFVVLKPDVEDNLASFWREVHSMLPEYTFE